MAFVVNNLEEKTLVTSIRDSLHLPLGGIQLSLEAIPLSLGTS